MAYMMQRIKNIINPLQNICNNLCHNQNAKIDALIRALADKL